MSSTQQRFRPEPRNQEILERDTAQSVSWSRRAPGGCFYSRTRVLMELALTLQSLSRLSKAR